MQADTFTETINHGVTLVGGGSCTRKEYNLAVKHAPFLIGMDGGAEIILDFGSEPELIIGDLDSLSEASKKRFKLKIIKIHDQDRTDMDKCVGSINAPFILSIGILGDRVDHALGAYNVLLKYPQKRLLLLNSSDVCFLGPPKLSLRLPLKERISLFPFTVVKGKSEGLNWEIDDINFDPRGMTGISNFTRKPITHLNFSTPGMIVIVPLANLSKVLDCLKEAPGW